MPVVTGTAVTVPGGRQGVFSGGAFVRSGYLWYNSFMVTRKHKWFSFRTVLFVLTFILVGYVVYQNWSDILETLKHIREANGFVLMLLIPEQLFMYYACGQIFFSYLKNRRDVRKFSNGEILKISTELNFVNHAVPAGGIGGLAFLTYRNYKKLNQLKVLNVDSVLLMLEIPRANDKKELAAEQLFA